MASDGSVLMIEPASIPLPASPHTSIQSKATTNSLVSVRLSEPQSSKPQSAEGQNEGVLDTESVTDDAPDGELGNDEDVASVHSDDTLEAEPESGLPRDSVSEVATQSSLADELDFEKGSDAGVFEPEPPTAMDNHRASVISEITDSVVEFPAFGVSRSSSSSSHTSTDSAQVDWKELDETEKAEQRDEASDESTAFLLARLEQENNALVHNPKAGYHSRIRKESRPPSMHVLKKMVQSPTETQRRFSVLPDPPPMTELEFWAALVKDYAQTAQRLPTLTANKIKGGVPPPLRGVVWMSMVGGARDADLSDDYEKLIHETSPYENMIGKDIGRSFPGVEMFKEAGGEGQQMLGRVLKAFSLYDKDIGYCQGLGFLVGPLLMQMPDKDAFCVLVRLMENYNLRSCYLPDLSGLHLRIYQFQQLLNQHMPELAAHLASLQVEAAYLSQWFLSFFAVTCPLPMLFRIYDVILAEGASETIMRVSLSLMRRNESKLMVQTEFEEVMQLLLSRALWEPYSFDADDLVNDFTGWTGLVTREALQKLETSFNAAPKDDTIVKQAFFPSVTAAASGFLGRLWTSKQTNSTLAPGGHGHSKSQSVAAKRVTSKPSVATVASVDISSEGNSSNNGSVGTTATDATSVTRESAIPEVTGLHSKSPSTVMGSTSRQDKGLHGQIEDLLTAMTEMQREQTLLTNQLQKEREERDDDHKLFTTLITHLKSNPTSNKLDMPANAKHKRQITAPAPASPSALSPSTAALTEELAEIVKRVEDRMSHHKDLRRSSMLETKQRLRDSLMRSKDQLSTETHRARELSRQLDQQEQESSVLREQLREARTRISEGFQDKQRLERQLQDYKSQRKQSLVWTDLERPTLWRSDTGTDSPTRMSVSSNTTTSSSPNTPHTPSTSGGLRELKLGAKARDSRRDSLAAGGSPTPPATVTKPTHPSKGSTNSSLSAPRSNVPQRGSSLATQSILSTRDHAPAPEDQMLLELVNAKTAEAVARQELEQLRSEMLQLRRFIAGGGPGTPPISTSSSTSALGELKGAENALKLMTGIEDPKAAEKSKDETTPKSAKAPAANASISSIGGFWSWGRKVSQPVKKAEETKDETVKDGNVEVTVSGEQEPVKAA